MYFGAAPGASANVIVFEVLGEVVVVEPLPLDEPRVSPRAIAATTTTTLSAIHHFEFRRMSITLHLRTDFAMSSRCRITEGKSDPRRSVVDTTECHLSAT